MKINRYRVKRSALAWSLGLAALFLTNAWALSAEKPFGLLVDLVEKTDVVWRDGYPTQLPIDQIATAIERVQYVEIQSSRPYFSWIVPRTPRDVLQSARQIQLASDRKAFEPDGENLLLWDSGKVADSSSTAVRYDAEAPLQPATTYYFRVKYWDQNDEASDWSELKAFRTASELQEYASTRYPIVKSVDYPVKTVELDDAVAFLDFGRASFGQINVEIYSPVDGAVALVRLGERVKDGRVDRKPAGTTRYWEYRLPLMAGRQTYSIKTRVDQRNSTGAAFKMPNYIGEVFPFRYAEVEFVPDATNASSDVRSTGALTFLSARRETATYPFDETASYFRCDSEELNKVWDLCKYSIKATTFAGVYLDGDRERIPYEGDALLNQLSHYSVDREYSLARFSQEYMIFHPTWPTEWNLQSVQMAWYDYLYTGDARNIARYYDDLKAKSLVALAEEDGLISTRKGKLTQEVLDSIHFKGSGFRDIVDWPHKGLAGNENAESGETDGFVFTDLNAVVNAYHFFALKSMKRFAEALDKKDDVEFFSKQIEKVSDAYQKVFLDSELGIYRDGEATTHASLHANMFPLAFGLVPPERVASVTNFVKSRGMRCSVYGAQFLLESVYEGEDGAYGLERMTADDLRGWLNMLRVGSTITLEAWDDRYKPNQDWNHAWGAAPANIIPRKLVGVEPLVPGASKIRIKPQIADLKSVEARVPTIRGAVDVNIRRDDSSYVLNVSVPGNVKADVYVPALDDDDELLVDGAPARDVVEGVVREGGFWKLPDVGSGERIIERHN